MISDKQVTSRQKYKNLKRKLKLLLYEQECFLDELRKSERKMIKVQRDKNFLLDRLLQYERVDDSSGDSDQTMSSGESDSEIPSMSRAASSAKHERGSPAMASAFPGHGFPFHHDQSPSGSMLSSSMPGLYNMMHPQNQGLHPSASFNGGHRMGNASATGRQRGRPRGVGTGGARGSGKVRGRSGVNTTTTSSVSSSITTPGTAAISQTIPSSSSQVPVSNPSTSSPTDQPSSVSGNNDLVILPVQTSAQLTSMSSTVVSQTSNPMLSQSSFSAQQPSSNCQPKPMVMGPPATTSQPFIQDSDDILLGEDLRNDDVDRCLYERIPEGLPADIFSDNSTEEGMGGLGSSVSSEA